MQNEEHEAQKLAQLLIFSFKELVLNRHHLDHEVVLFFHRDVSSCCLDILCEERVDIVDDDSLLRDILLGSTCLVMICVRHVYILCLGHTLKDLFHKKYFVVDFDSLESAYELFITLPGTKLPETFKIK